MFRVAQKASSWVARIASRAAGGSLVVARDELAGSDGDCLKLLVLAYSVGNKMHKAFSLLGESSHWQYKFSLPVEGVSTARRIEISLPGVCTAMMKKLPVKENW
nr:hypothetical protein [Tanacetum cinerariifolium]